MVFEGHKTVREGRKMVFTRPFPVLPANKPIQKPSLPQTFLLVCQRIFLFCLICLYSWLCLIPTEASRLMRRRRSGERHGIDAALHEIRTGDAARHYLRRRGSVQVHPGQMERKRLQAFPRPQDRLSRTLQAESLDSVPIAIGPQQTRCVKSPGLLGYPAAFYKRWNGDGVHE